MTANLLTLNTFKTTFPLIGLKQQIAKISLQNCTLDTTHSAGNQGFIFDEHPTFSDQIFALSKSCSSHTRELRCICPYLNSKTASSTISTSVFHSKLVFHLLFPSLFHTQARIQGGRTRRPPLDPLFSEGKRIF